MIHRVVDRRGDRIALAGQQRRGDRAGVAGQRLADARVDRIAHAADGDRIAQPPAAAVGCGKRLDRAEHEARRADALEIDVAREIVAAGTQRP